MFLKMLENRNPALIDASCYLRNKNLILPDTYVLDLDTIILNTISLQETAEKHNIELFYMTKQIGRNPLVAQQIAENGISHAVVVDYKEALLLKKHNLPIGHIGHLVQVPLSLLEEFILYGVKYITVYSIEELNKINEVCKKYNIKQNILIKIIEEIDIVYDGQQGGFKLNELSLLGHYINSPFANIAGITSFPCFLYDGKKELIPTENINSLNMAKSILTHMGCHDLEVNMPSATCGRTIPLISSLGGTQGEPGHALTGTTPLHAKEVLAEKPALLYISEVSHNFNDKSFIFGGGYYPRGHLDNIIVQNDKEWKHDIVEPINSSAIDYYWNLANKYNIGSLAIACFRTQIFVTRSDVAVVSGIQTGNVKLEGIFDSLGYKKG